MALAKLERKNYRFEKSSAKLRRALRGYTNIDDHLVAVERIDEETLSGPKERRTYLANIPSIPGGEIKIDHIYSSIFKKNVTLVRLSYLENAPKKDVETIKGLIAKAFE